MLESMIGSSRRPAETADARPELSTARAEGWPPLANAGRVVVVQVNVGQAKTDLSKLLVRVEAGEDIEIARDGVPVARLVRINPAPGPGARFLAARGSLAGRLSIGGDFEFTDAEIDQMLDDEPP